MQQIVPTSKGDINIHYVYNEKLKYLMILNLLESRGENDGLYFNGKDLAGCFLLSG